jgi:DNA-directed RNA polymerase alpha subunit
VPKGQGFFARGRKAGVAIRFNAKINLNGDYLVRLTLSKEEIGKLFFLQFGDCTIEELFRLFNMYTKEPHPHVLQKLFEETGIRNPLFFKKVEDLGLPERPLNCCKNDYIVYVGDLVQRTEAEMLRTPNFGRRSFNEVKEKLAEMSLHLGTEIPNWPPENIEEWSERLFG